MIRQACIATSFALASFASAEPLTTAFTYQAELSNGGTPATGLHDLRFRLLDAASGGAQVGATLCADNVPVSDGRFAVQLDFGAVFAGQRRFLEIEVRADTGLDCTNNAGFTILGPRQELTSAPSATFAANAANAVVADSAQLLNGQSSTFYQNAANLTAGSLPSARFAGSYSSEVSLTNSANTYAGSGALLTDLNASSFTSGTISDARLSNNVDLLGVTQTFTARKTFGGGITIPTGAHAGFVLTSDATGAASWGPDSLTLPFQGFASTNSGNGAFYVSNSNGIAARLYSLSSSHAAIIASNLATNGTGEGGQFVTTCTAGIATHGLALATTGVTYGGYFENQSPTGRGLLGFVDPPTSGVNYGVIGETTSLSTGYGVLSNGRFAATGTKSFRIDHPDDPANKYLFHYSSESPEVTNFYSGTVGLDPLGQAEVELPRYFAKINRDPRYMLTPVGTAMPMLHVSAEIDAGSLAAGAAMGPGVVAPRCFFRIAGGAPGGKVSWRIEAIRNDRFVQVHGAPVELEKEGPERGTYQHPHLYGEAPAKSLLYHAEQGAYR